MVKDVEKICCDKCGKLIAYITGNYACYYHEEEFCPECWKKEEIEDDDKEK